MERKSFYKIRMRNKGQITVPGEIRSVLGVEEGDDVVFHLDEQGRVIIERARTIPPDQAWFWSERWQQMEKEAQTDIEAGRIMEHDSIEDLINDLDAQPDAEDQD
jgi:AbrB family looped-hinge helix DNA binding protein